MDYQILTRTPLFDFVNGNHCEDEIESAYLNFASNVFSLLSCALDAREQLAILRFTEVELLFCEQVCANDTVQPYFHKAATLVQRMVECLTTNVFPMQTQTTTKDSPIKWTGSMVELVELLYACKEQQCFNNGEMTVKELTEHFAVLFNVNAVPKDCYRTYNDIRNRKNDSRTYFLDKLQSKLNEKLRKDDLAEMGRR